MGRLEILYVRIMQKFTLQTGSLKVVTAWLMVFFIRLVPFRPPNVEPMLATVMPFAKAYGVFTSFLFGFLGIGLFDLASGKVGEWTFITGAAYGLLGVCAHYFFRRRAASIKNFLGFGIVGTIAYDAVTGLSVGPLFFGQSFMEALTGQIPFTLLHLGGTIGFSLVLSPLLYRWVVMNRGLEMSVILGKLKAFRNAS